MSEYAEQVNYWQTSRTGTDTWLDNAKRLIARAGGTITGDGMISNQANTVFLLTFEMDGDTFRMAWPVLESKSGNLKAARIQAATALYHEVKAAVVKAKFLGTRTAFFAFLALSDGRTAADLPLPDVRQLLPPREDILE